MKYLLGILLCFWSTAFAQELPRYLFYWTNSKHDARNAETLAEGRLPLKPSVVDGYGQTDFFSGAHPETMDIPKRYTWSDVIGSMGSTQKEFYAKLDYPKGVKPRLYVAEVNPKAKFQKMTSYVGRGGVLSTDGEKIKPGTSLILHEVYDTSGSGGAVLKFQEWIILNDAAYTKVHSRLTAILPFVNEGLQRLQNQDPIQSHSPSTMNFNRNRSARRRAEEVLRYILTGKVPTSDCAHELGDPF